jgi:putative endonuclease
MDSPPARGEFGAMPSTHDLGRRFEDQVARHLEEKGWEILERNVRFGRKEVDLVARRGETVAFVEVKGRRGPAYGHPLHAITWRKRREIQTVALWWIQCRGQPEWTYRFDAVSVELSREGHALIHHVEDAWRVE